MMEHMDTNIAASTIMINFYRFQMWWLFWFAFWFWFWEFTSKILIPKGAFPPFKKWMTNKKSDMIIRDGITWC